jgi:hypothetical protein
MRLFPCNLGIRTYPVVPVKTARRFNVSSVREHLKNKIKTTTPNFARTRFPSFGRKLYTWLNALGSCEFLFTGCVFTHNKKVSYCAILAFIP